MGVIVNRFVSDDEKYATITLDDSTETIRCKAFVNTKIFDGYGAGDFVDVFGLSASFPGDVSVFGFSVTELPEFLWA